MTLTPFNRYLFSEADRIHVVDECVLLEISPSKRHIKIQAPHFTQWVKEDRVVFLEDLGKADPESIRNPDYERVTRPCITPEGIDKLSKEIHRDLRPYTSNPVRYEVPDYDRPSVNASKYPPGTIIS